MANLFPPLFPLPPLKQPYTSSCDCSMNIRNAREERNNLVSVVYEHTEDTSPFPSGQCPKGNISIEKVASEDNIVDILSLPLKRESLNYLRQCLGLMELIP
ncbi:hypothetical protein Tco_0628128 [Tanacetum coccineum]|uniref:Uncharacterized protein n=1 Tax=Tanacetum coccineum TaxID=301880 RepID=A0ABQ4WQ82_9ASTR